jgi:phage terminase small subunit
MADEAPNPKRRHKTQKPPLSEQMIRFARLVFARHGQRPAKTLLACYLEAGFPPCETDAATHTAAHRLVKNRHFREFYRVLQQRAADVAMLDSAEVIQALRRIATADRTDIMDEHGRVLPKSEWPADVRGAIEGIENEEIYEVVSQKGQPKRRELRGYVRKVKTARRTEALKLLAQILRMIGQDADAAKPPASDKNAAVLEVELGPETVEPPLDAPPPPAGG